MLSIPGLRPENVLKLYETLGVTSLAELEQAARGDRIRTSKGLGASLQTKILQNIAIAKSGQTSLHMHRANTLLEKAAERLKRAQPSLSRIVIAGDLRRGCELIGNLALVAEASNLTDGPNTVTSGGELKVYLTDSAHFGATLLHATGSKAHLDSLAQLAKAKGFKLDWRQRLRVAPRSVLSPAKRPGASRPGPFVF